MKKLLLSLLVVGFSGATFCQTTHQVCISEVSGAPCSNNNGVFTPANLNIAVGDMIQFTTHMVAITGYNGNHQIRFNGGSSQDVVLPISTNIISPVTTVTTTVFNTPGVYSMECVNSSHCQNFAQLLEGWSCTGYSVTVGTTTEIEEEQLKHQLSIFPNPAKDVLTINLEPVLNDNPKIYLVDVLGKTVKGTTTISTKSLSMNVADLSQGTYFVKIVTNMENYSYPVVIQ